MKFIKLIFAAVITLTMAHSAIAQKAQVYTLLSGGTTWLPAASTNVIVVGAVTNLIGNPGTSTNLVQTVAEYDNVGLCFQFVTAATNSSLQGVTLRVFKSFNNGVTFDDLQTFGYNRVMTSAATYTTNANLSVAGVTHLGFVIESSGGILATNVLLQINLKSPKYGARQATQ